MADGSGQPVLDISLQERQSQAFLSKSTELLYGGGTYGGKSHLLRAAAIIWCVQIPGLQVYLFRREFPDLYKNHMEGPTGFPMMLLPWVNTKWAKINYGKNTIEFWNGSKIHLCHCQYEKDMYQYDGAEIHVLMIDELTHFPENIYRYLRGRVRLGGLFVPPEFRDCFPRIVCGTNPGGVGHNWVKAFWIKLQKPFDMMRMAAAEGGLLRQFIPALATDNPIGIANDPNYMANQAGLGDSALVRARRDGDWDIVAGGALDDVWTQRVIIPRIPIPNVWTIDRSFDWGSTAPFSVLWFAEADGTEIRIAATGKLRGKHPGYHWCPPKRSLIVCHEWYGARTPNVGLKMGAKAIARGIKEREQALLEGNWINMRPRGGPADNQINAGLDPSAPTLKAQMEEVGVTWTESNKTPGSRKIGLDTIRDMIKEASRPNEQEPTPPESPCIYIMDHCRELISHLPVLPRDPKNSDDVDTAAEDHDYDALRYRVLAQQRVAKVTKLPI